MKRVLTIAGSDSGGGAGIQTDLKTINVLGGYGLSVITALTAQNTVGVSGVHLTPPDFVAAQLDAVLSDIGADAAKTGMLATAEIIQVVADKLRQYEVKNLVVDPVMVAKSGDSLIDDPAKAALKALLLPLAALITPNIPEAEELTGLSISGEDDMIAAAKALAQAGAGAVLVKGGHLDGPPVDILFDGREVHRFPGHRINTKNSHGTGCTISAALATLLAQGMGLTEAVDRAKVFITKAIAGGLAIGRGHGPTNPAVYLTDQLERGAVLEDLAAAADELALRGTSLLAPEVSSQLAFCLPYAGDRSEVAAFPGRIVRYRGGLRAVGCPAFGASSHIAKVLLAARQFDTDIRSAMAVAYSEEIVAACRRLGYKVASFSRADEPAEVKALEGSSLEWGTTDAFTREGVSDVVFDLGEPGKEPVVRLLGRDPAEVVGRALAIQSELEGRS